MPFGNNPLPLAIPEEQIRQVTVVFALLNGVQSLVEQCDPEELKDLLDACFRLLTAEVVARGGTIDKYMADSLMALFGVPIAHEDDPARAASAALGMLSALEPFNRELFKARGFQLELKIGINTGRVLVGSVAGTQDITVMGDVVNTASRVEQAAPVGSVLVCESTRRGLGERFVLKAQPPLRVKGKSQPLTVFRVMQEQGVSTHSGVPLASLPLVGREDAFERLARGWRRAVRPEGLPETAPGTWMTLLADVGMGKARLLREFHRYVEQDPLQPRIVSTWGVSYATGAGMATLRRLIEGLIRSQPGDSLETTWQRLVALGATLAGSQEGTDERIRPEGVARALLRLMGLPAPDRPLEPPQLSQALELRREGLSWLRALIAQSTLERPLLILADDLHLAEDAALECLEAIGGDPPPRVLILTAARPRLLERRPLWGRTNQSHLRVELEPLTLPEAHTLMRAMVGEDTPFSPRLIEAMHRFTGGNPLYLTETLRDYLETHGSNALVSVGGSALAVPTSLEGVLQSRLDRLPFEAALTLRAAAVIGTTFWRGALTALLGADRSDALELLKSRGFIQRRAGSSLPAEEEYLFDHALTAAVASGNLLESTRRRYHLLTAEWLEARRGDSVQLELSIAHHFEAAGELARAVPFLARAGEQALTAYDCAGAVTLFDRALAGIEATASGTAAESQEPLLKVRLLSWRGEAQRMRGALEPALVDFQAAAGAALALGEKVEAAASWYRAGLVFLALGMVDQALNAARSGDQLLQGGIAPAIVATGLQLRGELLMHQGRHGEAREALEQGVALWRRLDDRWRMAQGLHTLGRVHMATGDYRAAQRAFRDVAQLREALGDTHGLAITLHNLGAAADRLGDFPESLAHYHRSLRLHRRVDNRRGMAATLVNQGVGYLRCGYLGRALVAFEESLELYQGFERPYEIATCEGNLGALWLQVGRLEEAERHLSKAIKGFMALGRDAERSECLTELSACLLETGELDRARTAASVAFEASSVRPGGEAEARALQLLGAVALLQGDLEGAQQHVEELEWNEEAQVSAILQVSTALLSGWIRLEAGQYEPAIARFAEAVERAAEHDLAPMVWRAQTSLAQALEGAGRVVRREGVEDAWRELLARVEDPGLVQMLKERRWPRSCFWI